MGVAPTKIIFVVILSFEVALVTSQILKSLLKKETNKCKEKFVILQSIGIIAIKSSETRAVIYTCSGHFLILIIQLMGLTCPQEYVQV